MSGNEVGKTYSIYKQAQAVVFIKTVRIAMNSYRGCKNFDLVISYIKFT